MELVRGALIALSLASAESIAQTPVSNVPIVEIDAGRIAGTSHSDVVAFRGIRYAAAPVGALRWRPPQPVAHWSDVRRADVVGAICPQRYDATDNGTGPLPMSEDCLTLNVFAPTLAPKVSRPVMVWIHGGAYVNGSGTAPLYDGTALARQGVVVIALNYRLGRLGFFAHPALDRDRPAEPHGNYGLMDIIEALQWVHRNAHTFGGDPGNVTVFGESAGGGAVNLLMASPAARGLFHRAVSQSGIGRGPGCSIDSAEAAGVEFARVLGVQGDSADALRAVPIESILEAGDPALPFPWTGECSGPMIDGKIVTRPIDETFKLGVEAPVPYLVGSNALEFPPGTFPESSPPGKAVELLKKRLSSVSAVYESAQAFDVNLLSDVLFTEPAHKLAQLHARTGAPTYLYRFSVIAEAAPFKLAAHASDRQYVFGNLDTLHWAHGPRDIAAARVMGAYWVDFAASGDPNGGNRPVWPRYQPQSDTLLEFTNAGPVVQAVPAAKALESIGASYR